MIVIVIIIYLCVRVEEETEDDVRTDNPTGSTTSASSPTLENTSSNVLINVLPLLSPPIPQYYSSECCVCLDRPATVWGQCGHVCWCSDCALTALIKSNDHTMMLHCPLCRQNSTLITAV